MFLFIFYCWSGYIIRCLPFDLLQVLSTLTWLSKGYLYIYPSIYLYEYKTQMVSERSSFTIEKVTPD